MKRYGIAATITGFFLFISFSAFPDPQQRSMAEKELRIYEVTPGELSRRKDIQKDLRWWQECF